MSKQPEYSNAFIRKCELLFQDIRENKPLKTCIEKLRDAQSEPSSEEENSTTRFEPLWFIYYMYFAIHNPKLEEYINMKNTSTTNSNEEIHILKNMIRRRANTSTLVFQLYMYANIQKGAVTYIYPSSASSASSSNPPVSILKSLASSHLKTAAAVIHKLQTDKRISIETIYAVYIANLGIPSSSPSKLSNIKYTRKDIIFLALVCYMKIDEIDINTKGIFIAATKEEIAATETATTTPQTTTPHNTTATPPPATTYDQKYKYLLT
jgi:hypothetical protein